MRNFLVFSIVLIAVYFSLLVTSSSVAQESTFGPDTRFVLMSDVEWKPLNPARGDKGPKAGSLWGDFTGTRPSGFLVKFVDGFLSPPHIHNITYRGVVISGLLHNDDPDAVDMWMPAGSFWTQPAGEVHITAAKGSNNLAYIEIDNGPYLVLPKEEAFDNGESPVNVDESNIVWLDSSNTTWIDQSESPVSTKGIKIAFLWGNPKDDQFSGTLVKLPAGFTGKIRTHGSNFRAVVIQGKPEYRQRDETGVKIMEPGSYFGSKGDAAHQVSCSTVEGCVIYVRMKGKFDVIPEF